MFVKTASFLIFFFLLKKQARICFFLDKTHSLVAPARNWTDNDSHWNSRWHIRVVNSPKEKKTIILGRICRCIIRLKLTAIPYLWLSLWDQNVDLLVLKLKVIFWSSSLPHCITQAKEIWSIIPWSCWMTYFFSKGFITYLKFFRWWKNLPHLMSSTPVESVMGKKIGEIWATFNKRYLLLLYIYCL